MITKKLGFMVTVDGIDGCGKTTTIKQIQQELETLNIPVLVVSSLQQTAIGRSIRTLLMEQSDKMDFYTQVLLMLAARRDIYNKIIAPAIIAGKVVLIDRWVESTIAYQAFGPNDEQSAVALAREIISLTARSIGLIQPRKRLVITIDQETRKERCKARGNMDSFDSKDDAFFRNAIRGYDWCISNLGDCNVIQHTALEQHQASDALHQFTATIIAEYLTS